MSSNLPISKLKNEAYKPLSANTSFADFETDGLGGSFICGGFTTVGSDEVRVYHSVDGLFDLIEENQSPVIYFHNLEYDGRYIIDFLIKQEIAFQIINRVNRLLLLRFFIGEGENEFEVKIVDSYAMLMDSLKKLSKVFAPEFEKRSLNLDKVTFNPLDPVHMEYLVYDCLALKYVVINSRVLIHETFGVNARYTTSSTALRYWQTTVDKPIFRLGKEKEEFTRKSYSGGLVYVSKVDLFSDVSVYDVNSMYPSVMRDNAYPVGGSYFTDRYEGQGFYEVTVDATNSEFLFISGFDERTGKKIPKANGKFKAFISDVEYKLALRLGYRIKIIKGLVFEESSYLFTEFVNTCERLRLAHGKDSVGMITKYIQNSLYGKFGTKETREQIYYSPELLEDCTPYIDPLTGEFYGLYVDELQASEPYMLPHLASYTTALARCKLVNLVLKAGIENCFYCDTDSLFVNREGGERLQDEIGEKYGMIKLDAYFSHVVIVAPKVYFGTGKNRAKGFPNSMVEDLRDSLLNGEVAKVGFTSLNSNVQILKKRKSFNHAMSRTLSALPVEVIEKIISLGVDNLKGQK